MDQLKDIKAIEQISIDYDLYLTIFGVIFALTILFLLIYLFLKFRKTPTRQDRLIKYLKKLDLDGEAKQIAYDFTVYGKECLDTQNKDEFNSIVSKLEEYKYKKTTNIKLCDDLKADMREYIKVRL